VNTSAGRTPQEIGADVAEAISGLVDEFERVRVFPLMDALGDVFGTSLSDSIEQNGIDAASIRNHFADLERAWLAGNFDMMPELLEFRDMQEWLKVCDALDARGQMLDWIQDKFEGYKAVLWERAAAMIGARVLSYGL
jgi:hypothetical protein